MAAPVLIWSESNGPGEMVSDGIPFVQFASIDRPSTISGLAQNYQITPATNSFEKWLRLKVIDAATNTLTAFSVWFAPQDILDSAGATGEIDILVGTNHAYAAPVSTDSAVAVADYTAHRGAANGIALTAPGNVAGDYSAYMTLQGKAAADAAQGGGQFPIGFLVCGYSWS